MAVQSTNYETYSLSLQTAKLNRSINKPHSIVIADCGRCRVINANDCDLNFNFRQGNASVDLACQSERTSSGLPEQSFNYYQSHWHRPDAWSIQHRRSILQRSASLVRSNESCNGDLNFIGNGRCHPPDASREQVPFKFQSSQWAQVRDSRGCHLNFNFAQ